ncbi:MAG: YdeI/OmpD-associated family protein [Sphingomicrobium sp.]
MPMSTVNFDVTDPMTEQRGGLPIIAFIDRAALECWLEAQPAGSPGLWIKFAKAGSGIASVSKADAIDAALCNGWIDGQLDKYDETSWLIRFTPRRTRSKWSQVNRARAAELIEAGRMHPRGMAQIEAARSDGRWDAAYAPASKAEVPPDLQAALDQSPKAAAFFATLTGANRYAILYRIGAVKKADTRARKIAGFIAMLERHETVHR